jgi:hypothetical protein
VRSEAEAELHLLAAEFEIWNGNMKERKKAIKNLDFSCSAVFVRSSTNFLKSREKFISAHFYICIFCK